MGSFPCLHVENNVFGNNLMRNKEDNTIVDNLIDDALMTVDMEVLQPNSSPFRMSSYAFKGVDGTKYSISLVCDRNISTGGRSLFLWTSMEGKYVEDVLIEHVDSLWDTLQNFPADEKKRIEDFADSLEFGGRDVMLQRIEEEGIHDIHSLVLPHVRRNKMLKIPCTCALSYKGHVFDGIDGIRENCHCQEEDATPYILERTGILQPAHWNSFFQERYRCYMMCYSKEYAEKLIRPFLNLNIEENGTFERLEYMFSQDSFPPIAFYVEREKYMFLSF